MAEGPSTLYVPGSDRREAAGAPTEVSWVGVGRKKEIK